MKLLHITIHVNDKASFKVKAIDVIKETNKQYKIDTKRKFVNKNELLNPNTLLRNSVDGINYYCYCLLEDEKKAKDLLFNKAEQRIYEINIGVLNMFSAINKFKYS